MVWKKRGLYPSLTQILEFFDVDYDAARAIGKWVEENKSLEQLFDQLEEDEVPEELDKFEDDLFDLYEQRFFRKNIGLIKNLSLLNLTNYKIEKI